MSIDESKLPLDKSGRPNRSYLGHTSDIFPTPWDNEGAFVEVGAPKRFKYVKDRNYAEEQERIRLAGIENAGRCASRRNRYDGWCRRWPQPGMTVCYRHGGKFKHSKKAAAKRVEQQKLQEGAKKIIRNARK